MILNQTEETGNIQKGVFVKKCASEHGGENYL